MKIRTQSRPDLARLGEMVVDVVMLLRPAGAT